MSLDQFNLILDSLYMSWRAKLWNKLKRRLNLEIYRKLERLQGISMAVVS